MSNIKQPDWFAVGDTVYSKENGKGKVVKIDPDNPHFHYDCIFDDGTKAWRPESDLLGSSWPENINPLVEDESVN